MRGYNEFVILTERLSKKESISLQKKAHLLLLCAHKNKSAIPSSKLYEYIGVGKPVLVCPSDKGIIEETLTKTGQGIFCNSEEEAFVTIERLYLSFLKGEEPHCIVNLQEAAKYTREEMVKNLAEELQKI
jgi:hypothetical protein